MNECMLVLSVYVCVSRLFDSEICIVIATTVALQIEKSKQKVNWN